MSGLRAELCARLLGGWRTSLAGLGLLALLGLLHLSADTLRGVTDRVTALGELLAAITSTAGTLGGLMGAVALLLARGREG